MMNYSTTYLCDLYAQSLHLQIAESIFKSFGNAAFFSGQITTLKVFEDDQLIKQVLNESVTQRILVIDGCGSHRCALIDADLAQMAIHNGWQGLIIYGCVRQTLALNELNLGIRALHAHPLKPHKAGIGERDTTVTFAGIHFKTDHYLYADADGIIVSDQALII
ncbi:MAG: hypothetical protein RL637_1483 [Pseudomonadota bacterium]|jgi:regulator of ribonuclease activity A